MSEDFEFKFINLMEKMRSLLNGLQIEEQEKLLKEPSIKFFHVGKEIARAAAHGAIMANLERLAHDPL